MRKIFIPFILIFLFNFDLAAQEIKIGTVAPAGSVWETTLKEIAAEWTRISNGEVVVRIYAGGTVGDEDDIIRKMRVNRLQAAALTSQGLKEISYDLFALSLPMVIQDDSEFDYVFGNIKPLFEKMITDRGFVPLGWTNTGWVKWFTKTRAVTPDDMRQLRIAVDNSDEKALQVWQRAGFRVVPLALPDLVSGLFSGMAEGTYITPYAANAMGLTELTPYMLDLSISPVYGSLIISERAWRRINDRYKPLIQKRTEEILNTFYARITAIENQGLQIMERQGLQIVKPDAAALEAWYDFISETVEEYAMDAISPELYSEIKKHVNEYRKK